MFRISIISRSITALQKLKGNAQSYYVINNTLLLASTLNQRLFNHSEHLVEKFCFND